MEPLRLLRGLSARADVRHPVLLYSGDPAHPLSTRHVLAANPARVVRGYADGIVMESAGGRSVWGPARANVLEDLWHRFLVETDGAGIAIGTLGYEFGTWLERVPRAERDVLGLPDFWLGFYPAHMGWGGEDDAVPVYKGVPADVRRLEELAEAASPGETPVRPPDAALAGPREAAWTRERYGESFRRIRDYIHAGDIYQANLAQRFRFRMPGEAVALFEHLAARSPVPFAAFLDCGDHQVLSLSPECFLRSAGGRIETMPIKGTRPRGESARDDSQLRKALEASEKDQAEHVMIVDLERNDLGRVCGIGSVHVPQLLRVESYSRVHHLVSTVAGTLRPGTGSFDVLRATFPGGSITGAPKIRAMEIIAETEGETRGVYTGAIGILEGERDMTLSIAIRTAVLKDGWLHYHAGGGLVSDSEEEAEYRETFDKMAAFEDGLRSFGGGSAGA